MVVDEQVRVYMMKEEPNGKVQSETNQVKMECEVNQGGCLGDKRMYLWTMVKGSCLFQTVTTITGFLDNTSYLFTFQMILISFKGSHCIADGVLDREDKPVANSVRKSVSVHWRACAHTTNAGEGCGLGGIDKAH